MYSVTLHWFGTYICFIEMWITSWWIGKTTNIPKDWDLFPSMLFYYLIWPKILQLSYNLSVAAKNKHHAGFNHKRLSGTRKPQGGSHDLITNYLYLAILTATFILCIDQVDHIRVLQSGRPFNSPICANLQEEQLIYHAESLPLDVSWEPSL